MPNVCDSSTVMTPSLPTFSMASAIMPPTSSVSAEIAATRAISSLVSISLERFLMSSTTCSTALSIPLRISIGFAPAATLRRPSLTMACARTVAVVVPSPATSLVFVATSLASCAPMFSYGSSSSISRAIVTPSLVMVGAPNFFSSTTLRPLGPSVTLTASASLVTPASSDLLASSSYSSIFGIFYPLSLLLFLRLRGRLALRQDVPLAQYEIILAGHLDFRSAVLRVNNLVAHGSPRGAPVFPLPSGLARPPARFPPGASPWRCRGLRYRLQSSLRLLRAQLSPGLPRAPDPCPSLLVSTHDNNTGLL